MATTLYEWVTTQDGVVSTGYNDAWMEFLADEGHTVGSINDRMYDWLGAEGYTGGLSDRLSAFIRATLVPYVAPEEPEEPPEE